MYKLWAVSPISVGIHLCCSEGKVIHSENYMYLCSSGNFSAVLYYSILRLIILSIVHLRIQGFPCKRRMHISCSSVSLEL